MGIRPQRAAYDHMRKNSTVDWIAFFDADEFLLLRRDRTIADFLARFDDNVSAVSINWVVFNGGGQERYRAAPVIEWFGESLDRRAPYNRSMNWIARRERLAGIGIHRQDIAEGRYVTPKGKDADFVTGQIMRRHEHRVAVLHHCMVKSLEEYAEKRNRGHANSQNHQRKLDKLINRFQRRMRPEIPTPTCW